jgi:lysyl-tRNA synthetase class 2
MTSFGHTKVKKTSKSIQVYRIRESPFSKGLQGYTRVSLAIKKFPTMKSIGGVKDENGVSSKPSEEVKAEPEKIDFSNVKIEPLFEEEVDFDTFSKSDFRAVKVKECVAVPKSKKLLQFTLDDGTGTDRTILSGIHAYYEPEELVGKTLIAITNLPPRKMMGIESCGMLLSAVNNLKDSEDEELHLLMVDNHIPAGAKLY